jgi:hypothetical protein
MSALARKSSRFHRFRLPRQHEVLAAVLVLSIVVMAVARALRASQHAASPFAPAAAIVL